MAEVHLISDESNDTKSSMDELPDFGLTAVGIRHQKKGEPVAEEHLVSRGEDDACVDLTQECFNINPDLHDAGSEADRLSISSRETGPYSHDDDAVEQLQGQGIYSSLPYSEEDHSDSLRAYSRSPDLQSQGTRVQKTGLVNDDNAEKIQNNAKRGGLKRKDKSGLERETRREQLERERASRRLAAGASKHYRPGECMKSMVVEVDSRLGASWFMEDARREVQAAGASLQLSALAHEGLVTWARRLPAALQVELQLHSGSEQCGGSLVVMAAAQVSPLVATRTLAAALAPLRQLAPLPLTLVVYGLKEYLRAGKGGRGKSKRAKGTQPPQPAITEIDFEMAVTDLMVSAGCGAVRVETSSELALCILHHTKAVAEQPYKARRRECEERAAFYMRGDNKNCLPIDKHGGGVEGVWQQMLAVLGASSLDTARALVAHFPTPRALYQACVEGEGGGVCALAGVCVRRAGGGEARARRLGPELARRLHALLTATAADGDALLL